jgi:hypothetical protein
MPSFFQVSILATLLIARVVPGAEAAGESVPAGIQWFATLKSARDEAERTGRPILLISGTPHCAGISGIW